MLNLQPLGMAFLDIVKFPGKLLLFTNKSQRKIARRPGRPSLPACRRWSIDFDGSDLVSTLGEHREDMPRPPVTDLGSRGALVVSGGVGST